METVSSLIRSELARLEWVQADLARVLGWPVQTLSEVMKDKRRIDASMALDLSRATSHGPEKWLSVQVFQELDKACKHPDSLPRLEEISARAKLEARVPVRELVKRKIISAGEIAIQEQEVDELLGPNPTWRASAKRSGVLGQPFSRIQTAWMALARRQAADLAVGEYDETQFADVVASLPRSLHAPADFVGLPHVFAEAGVALVHVKPFPGGRIDGVSMEVNGHPLIAISGRGKRLDKVMFAVLHESAHVISGHWLDSPWLHDSDGSALAQDEQEVEEQVNDLASSWIFPNGFKLQAPVTRRTISVLAETNGLSEAVVIGHLQHQGFVEWSSVLGRGLPSIGEALAKWP